MKENVKSNMLILPTLSLNYEQKLRNTKVKNSFIDFIPIYKIKGCTACLRLLFCNMLFVMIAIAFLQL